MIKFFSRIITAIGNVISSLKLAGRRQLQPALPTRRRSSIRHVLPSRRLHVLSYLPALPSHSPALASPSSRH